MHTFRNKQFHFLIFVQPPTCHASVQPPTPQKKIVRQEGQDNGITGRKFPEKLRQQMVRPTCTVWGWLSRWRSRLATDVRASWITPCNRRSVLQLALRLTVVPRGINSKWMTPSASHYTDASFISSRMAHFQYLVLGVNVGFHFVSACLSAKWLVALVSHSLSLRIPRTRFLRL